MKSIEKEGKQTEKKDINKLITERLRYRANSIAISKGDIYFKPLKSESSMSSLRRSTETL